VLGGGDEFGVGLVGPVDPCGGGVGGLAELDVPVPRRPPRRSWPRPMPSAGRSSSPSTSSRPTNAGPAPCCAPSPPSWCCRRSGGHLCCHFAIRTLMTDAATHYGHDPDRVSPDPSGVRPYRPARSTRAQPARPLGMHGGLGCMAGGGDEFSVLGWQVREDVHLSSVGGNVDDQRDGVGNGCSDLVKTSGLGG
jgi:hypothetical protein